MLHRYVGDIAGPDLVRTDNGQTPEQIWELLILLIDPGFFGAGKIA